MSLVGGNDGYTNIFGKPKPAPGWEQPLNKFVDSPVFPVIAGGLVGAGAAAAFGAGSAAVTAVKAAPSVIGAVTGGAAAPQVTKFFPTGGNVATTQPDPTLSTLGSDQTQLPGNIAGPGAHHLNAQAVAVPVPVQTNNTMLYLALAGIAYLILKRTK